MLGAKKISFQRKFSTLYDFINNIYSGGDSFWLTAYFMAKTSDILKKTH